MTSLFQNGTVILVHGAWADGSCWQHIILPLRRQGLRVTCAPIPLTSLHDDVAALQRVLERTNGPVVLVGHAYAGAVIAAAREERVKSLVYIAALAPDEGETVADRSRTNRSRSKGQLPEAYSEVSRISNFLSFEPDIVSVQLDGKELHPEPGQTVIPHGPDRELTVAEVLPDDRRSA